MSIPTKCKWKWERKGRYCRMGYFYTKVYWFLLWFLWSLQLLWAPTMVIPSCVLMVKSSIYSQKGTTQADSLAMAMYSIATLPLVHHLEEPTSVRQVWCAYDTGRSLYHLKDWWNELEDTGPDIEYYANATSLGLSWKRNIMNNQWMLGNSGVKITKDGQRHLGAALGTQTFVEVFVTGKIHEWTKYRWNNWPPLPLVNHMLPTVP